MTLPKRTLLLLVETISSNLSSTRAILKIWYLPSLCRTRLPIFKSNAIRRYYYCICHAKRIASKTSGCSSGMIDVTKQTLESKFDQVPEFKECVLQCSDKTEFLEASYDDYWGSDSTNGVQTTPLPVHGQGKM